jgi:two-component system sensor histidine kinase CssS
MTISLLLKKADMQIDTSANYINTVNDELLYYSIFKYHGFFDIVEDRCIIVLTDNTIKNQLVKETFLKLFFYGFIAFSIGYLIILLWTRYLVAGIKTIKNGIYSMNKTFYKEDIPLKRCDELGELVISINTMREQIYTNNKTKQELIQGISHDLKTPIAVIKSYAEAVEDGLSSPMDAASITLKQTKRLNEKVNNLLNLTRLDYITVNYDNMDSVRLDLIVSELLTGYSYQTTATFDVVCNQAIFDGDTDSWRIAIENILDNAIHYTKSVIQIRMDDHYLSIYNDGVPVDEAYMNSMFKPYEKSADGVFGLGLSIVYKTVNLYGYTIEVKNQDDGVYFIISR